jgi:hypothetical protein
MNTLIKPDTSELDALAHQLMEALALRDQNTVDWYRIELEISRVIFAVRDKFKADIAFGRWCKEHAPSISRDELQAYVAFGREIERAREILAKTERRSIQHIYRQEFRLRHVTQPKKPKTTKDAPKTDAALEAYDALKAAGIDPTRDQVAARAGVSGMPAQLAINLRKAEETAAKEGADVAELPKTAKEKAEVAVRKIQKKLELEFDQRLQAAVQKHVNDFILPMYAEKLVMADRIIAVNKKPFSIEEYRKLLAALHPDSSSPERRTEMFLIVKQRELLLRPADKDQPLSGDLPKTIEELLARRRKR